VNAQAAREQPISPLRWAAWGAALAWGVLMFYVLLTPLWLGLRVAARLAEFRAKASSR
jgi:hypothetical protein